MMLVAAACAPPAIVKRVDAVFPANVERYSDNSTFDAKVRVALNPDGSVRAVSIARTAGIAQFDAAALEAVKQWKFAPPAPGCEAESTAVVSVPFSGLLLGPSYDPCSHDVLALDTVTPEYPDSARNLDRRERGVQILVTVAANGSVTGTSITASSGVQAMDAAALTAAKAAIYAPKYSACRPVDGEYTFRATFDPNP
jgi:TonB family protein